MTDAAGRAANPSRLVYLAEPRRPLEGAVRMRFGARRRGTASPPRMGVPKPGED
jgi:hypothetical protein